MAVSDVITGYAIRPKYVSELEPKGFPNASYSPASFTAKKNSLSDLACRALIAYNMACAKRQRRKPAASIDLSDLTEDKLIYRRKA